MLLQQHHHNFNPKTDGSEENDIQLHFTNHLYLSLRYHYTHHPSHNPNIPKAAYSSSQNPANVRRAQ